MCKAELSQTPPAVCLFAWSPQVMALGLTAVLGTVVYNGVGLVNKLASLFFACVVVSIVCLCTGAVLYGAGSFSPEGLPAHNATAPGPLAGELQ